MKLDDRFWKISKRLTVWINTPYAFIGAILLVIVWFLAGFIFGFSDEHAQLINVITNVITFLMVFLIENSQNRDTKSIHLKLNELIKIHDKTDKGLLNIEEVPEKEFKQKEKVHKKKGRSKRRKFIAGKTTGESGVS